MSYVLGRAIGELPVTVHLDQEPIRAAMVAIAKAAGTEVVWRGRDIVYLGAMDPTDRAALVRRVRGADAEELRASLGPLMSQPGNLQIQSGGVLVAVDDFGVIERLQTVLDEWEAIGVPVWVVELYLVRMRDEFAQELALDGVITGDLAVALASSGQQAMPVASMSLSGLLQAVDESSGSGSVIRPLVVLADGEAASVGVTVERTLPRVSVTQDGTKNVTGYDTVRAGTVADIEVREQSDQAARVRLDVELTQFVPGDEVTVEGIELDLPLVADSGRVYLVAQMADVSHGRKDQTGLRLGRMLRSRSNTVAVFLRATRIGRVADGPRPGRVGGPPPDGVSTSAQP